MQLALIPVSDEERTTAAYHLVELLQALDDEEATWDDAKKAHRDNRAAIRQGIAAVRAVLMRAKQERDEGITEQQVNALLDQAQEHAD